MDCDFSLDGTCEFCTMERCLWNEIEDFLARQQGFRDAKHAEEYIQDLVDGVSLIKYDPDGSDDF
ncbi:MAG: hypothetical protein ACTSRA_04045 [Promethearchaeota archaeon]